ncbi:MAG: peptidoglycan DD-metalloendopeptidase family protein [Sandaracinaceae bacterium]|nr:peptidoglycan DD-metalloendopeptidase family protein [Sandaracinaceae bacterium]
MKAPSFAAPGLLVGLALSALVAGCDGGTMARPGADASPGHDGGPGALDAGLDEDGGAVPMDAGPGPMDAGPPPPACPRVRVTTAAGETLNIRPGPDTSMTPVGSLPSGFIVEVVGMVSGEVIGGVDLWYEIVSPRGDGFIFSGFAECTTDEIPVVEDGYYLPFACGSSVRVTQGNGGTTSHTGRTQYAFDFGVGLNTPIHAIQSGVVTLVRTATRPGDACYDGGDSTCGPYANYVVLQHADGNTSAYKHLNDSSLSVGDTVRRGDVVGYSGTTGYSTGPHLHMELRGDCPTEIYCQTIPLSFIEVGVPTSGQTVTSENCP